MKENNQNLWQQIFKASTIPLNLVASIFVGFAIGYALDSFFGTSPYLTAIFLLFGIITGFRELLLYARRQDSGDDKEGK